VINNSAHQASPDNIGNFAAVFARIVNGVIGIALILAATFAMANDATTLKEIMQGLRNNLVEISDGLLTDNFEQVERGATGIAEHPQIPGAQIKLVAAALGSEMPAFKQLDTLVHDLAVEIAVAARARDPETALAAYQQMLEGCLACHSSYKKRITAVLASAGSAPGST